MKSYLKITAFLKDDKINKENIEINYSDLPEHQNNPPNIRLDFAKPFIQKIVANNYYRLQTGDSFSDKTLNFDLEIDDIKEQKLSQYSNAYLLEISAALSD